MNCWVSTVLASLRRECGCASGNPDEWIVGVVRKARQAGLQVVRELFGVEALVGAICMGDW